MAGFRMHVSTSAVLGVGYAGVGHFGYGMPLDTSLVAGAMCGFSGMLPDLDSDYGVPLRETMAFTAAVIPMLLVGHFQQLHLSHDAMILVAVSLYLGVRFGVTNMIRRYTVHRGMFHSIPACLIFAGLAFLACGTAELPVRCFKAGGVAAGFMSHLLLDEIYAIEWKSGRWRFKKSFGTAIKFWSDDPWSNFSTYAKLVIVGMLILAQPSVFAELEARNPGFAQEYQHLQNRLHESIAPLPGKAQSALEAARTAANQFGGTLSPPAVADGGAAPPQPGEAWPVYSPAYAPPQSAGGFDTAQRPAPPVAQ